MEMGARGENHPLNNPKLKIIRLGVTTKSDCDLPVPQPLVQDQIPVSYTHLTLPTIYSV